MSTNSDTTFLYTSQLNPKLINEDFFIIDDSDSQLQVLSLNPVKTREKINKFINDKVEKLKVISDFDFTMTKMHLSVNKRGSSCHGVMEESNIFSDVYHYHSRKTLDIYYPIEIDPNMDNVTKSKYMLEWAEKSHNLILTMTDLTKSKLKLACDIAIKNPHVELRDYLQHFLVLLYKHNIPLLIFSAGISNILHELLHVSISNYFDKYITNYHKDIENVESFNQSKMLSYIDQYIADYNNFYLAHSLKPSNSESSLGFENDELTEIYVHGHETTEVELVDNDNDQNKSIHLHEDILDDVVFESKNNIPKHELAKVISEEIVDKFFIISNTFLFDDETEELKGFSKPTIHVLNKVAGNYIENCNFFADYTIDENGFYPYNIILLGDSPGDIHMTDGIKVNPDSCLKIGFLNDKIKERLDNYLNIYDIVIIGENQGFDVPLDIINRVIHNKSGI
mmetsp:Transcript_8031/g.7177  ORF Transcript_8031/g.7177 Transcript_8031/m.7177 type:complete len:452 (-) Transcript_8031:42-1397(-)